jgi:predicted phage terminase large subunit-like protein
MPTLTATQLQAAERLLDLVGCLRMRHCPLVPTARQEAFLRLAALEALFGGAAGGGKTVALLMAALNFADVPGYHALLLRPSLPEFELPGGLIELSHEWLGGTKADWSGETRSWRFQGPGRNGAGGASLRFGYLDGVKDVARYAGSSFSFLGFDELVRFEEQQYRRMFRVLRKPDDRDGVAFSAAPDGTRLPQLPVRVRSTSNPGGPNHGWVKSRFVDAASRHPGVIFLTSRLVDNPFLNREQYVASLAQLPAAERERLLHGDWEIPDEGELFQRAWFEEVERSELPAGTSPVRFWDLAASEPSSSSPDPDYTVGLRLELDGPNGRYYVSDIVRIRKAPGAVEQLVAATAARDGRSVEIVIEEEPGAAGRALTDRYKQHVLRGYIVKSKRATGAKEVRARIAAAAAQNGLIKIVRGANASDFLDELCAFPHAPHDDCVDALSGACEALTHRTGRLRSYRARGNIYDLAERAARRQNCAYDTPLTARRRQQLERTRDERLAAEIGVPLYDSGSLRL